MNRAVLVIATVLAGCAPSNDPPKVPQTGDLFPFQAPDGGYTWSADQYAFPGQWDTGGFASDGGHDDAMAPADSGGCNLGSATCSSPCQSDQACCPAGGGRCIKRTDLSGDAADKSVLAAVASACVSCWFSYPGQDRTCAVLDTCQLTGSVTQGALEAFVCKTAASSDFSGDDFAKAQEILNCGQQYTPVIGINRLEWKVSALSSGEAVEYCVIYDHRGGWGKDRVQIRRCVDGP